VSKPAERCQNFLASIASSRKGFRFAPLPIKSKMFQLIAYRGIQKGWQPVGRPRSYDAACQLRAIAKRINGDIWLYDLTVVKPELPSFI
jgi:hypothetical protein